VKVVGQPTKVKVQGHQTQHHLKGLINVYICLKL